jgi:hypothetical protein
MALGDAHPYLALFYLEKLNSELSPDHHGRGLELELVIASGAA